MQYTLYFAFIWCDTTDEMFSTDIIVSHAQRISFQGYILHLYIALLWMDWVSTNSTN